MEVVYVLHKCNKCTYSTYILPPWITLPLALNWSFHTRKDREPNTEWTTQQNSFYRLFAPLLSLSIISLVSGHWTKTENWYHVYTPNHSFHPDSRIHNMGASNVHRRMDIIFNYKPIIFHWPEWESLKVRWKMNSLLLRC